MSGPWREHGAPDYLSDAEAAVRTLLAAIGEDPSRPGLLDTPTRVVRAWLEMAGGREVDVAALLGRTFDDTCDEMVVVSGIRFTSLCEHHVLPFTGTAAIGYVPDGKVVGLSKLPRVLDAYARRLQVQERLTVQVAQAIEEHLRPKGVGVVLRATHSCMGNRGARQPDAITTTSELRGVMRSKPEARAEFLALANHRG